MPTQSERREATRAALLGAAERLFVRDGYDRTSTQAILLAAGLSRGALYHHFDSKEDLFAAVFEAVSARSVQRSARRAGDGGSYVDRLGEACASWLDEESRASIGHSSHAVGPRRLTW
jgi:AcrR family transcriptional regulator